MVPVDKSKMRWQQRVIYVKFCIQRSFSYLAILNGFGMMFLVADRLKLGRWYWMLALLLVVGLMAFGWLEYKLGLAKEEYELQCELMGLNKKVVNG